VRYTQIFDMSQRILIVPERKTPDCAKGKMEPQLSLADILQTVETRTITCLSSSYWYDAVLNIDISYLRSVVQQKAIVSL